MTGGYFLETSNILASKNNNQIQLLKNDDFIQ